MTLTTIKPLVKVSFPVLATFQTPASHHDADQADLSNIRLFERRPKLLPQSRIEAGTRSGDQVDLLACLEANPVPVELLPLFRTCPMPRFLAVALVTTFIRIYRSSEGAGLFTGPERYQRLAARLAQITWRVDDLFAYWANLTTAMQVGSSGQAPPGLLSLLQLPNWVQFQVLQVLADETESVLLYAREWAEAERLQTPAYAAATGQALRDPTCRVLSYEVDDLAVPRTTRVRQVPVISPNAVRHSLVREPGMLHLLDTLGIGLHDLPRGVALLLGSSNPPRKGAKAPDHIEALREEVKRRYPLLELLSGSLDGALLGPSVLAVDTWLVCTENREELARFGLMPDQPGEALIAPVTQTAHPETLGVGASPMPFGFETLIAGSQLLCEFTLRWSASELAAGALVAALDRAQSEAPRLGGQFARGFGRVELAWDLTSWLSEAQTVYQAYLEEHAVELRTGLLDGTLGTRITLCGG